MSFDSIAVILMTFFAVVIILGFLSLNMGRNSEPVDEVRELRERDDA